MKTNALAVMQLDDELLLLDSLPNALYGPVVTHSMGEVKQRAEAVLTLRAGLLKGELPNSPLVWPDKEIQQFIGKEIDNLNVAKYCHDNEDLVDQLLLEILDAIENISTTWNRLLAKNIKQLEDNALKVMQEAAAHSLSSESTSIESDLIDSGIKIKNTNKKKAAISISLSQKQKEDIRSQCEENIFIDVFEFLDLEDGFLDGKWHEYVKVWGQLESLFKDMNLVTGIHFDLSQGFFQSNGWLDIVKLNAVIEKIPQLKEVINTLGRMKMTDDEPVIDIVTEKIKQQALVDTPVVTPLAPMETTGVTRSGNINRMLPQESAMLSHPVLKRLWHARRAEEALCTYAVEGTVDMALMGDIEIEQEKEIEGVSQNKNMGPMIICLDTSGSMQGLPENIAKAIVLECLKVATDQKRQCLVYSFSGPGDIAEFELEASAQGIQKIISFLSMSFSGGTDVDGPLHKALDHCKENDWQRTDIMLVSDGAFHANSSLKNRITRRKKTAGLTVHGVVVGGNTSEFKTVCDPLHHFDEWEHMAAFKEYR